jgi:hypothetical protein
MEEREQRLVQAMVDLEDWAAGLRAHYHDIRQDIDAECMSLSRERQELLNPWAQLSITPEEGCSYVLLFPPSRLKRGHGGGYTEAARGGKQASGSLI